MVWMDGCWYSPSIGYQYRKNKLVYAELPQHVLTFSAGTHKNVLKLEKEISVVCWGQVVGLGDVCCSSGNKINIYASKLNCKWAAFGSFRLKKIKYQKQRLLLFLTPWCNACGIQTCMLFSRNLLWKDLGWCSSLTRPLLSEWKIKFFSVNTYVWSSNFSSGNSDTSPKLG